MNLNLPIEDSPSALDEHGPFFILGCPRSGTTFLSECIGSVAEIEEFAGVLAPPRLMHLIGHQASEGKDVRELLLVMRDVLWQSFWRRRFFTNERLARVLVRQKGVGSLLQKRGVEGSYFCYKEPFLCFAMPQVADHFPNAKFVHIVRDGRDNADSMERAYPDALSDRVLTDELLANNKNTEIGVTRVHQGYFLPWWVPTEKQGDFIKMSRYGRCVFMWQEMVSRAMDCGARLGSARYLQIRYESVVSDPLTNARNILQFLGFSLSRRAARKFATAHTASVGIGRKRSNRREVDEAAAIGGELLKQLGYQV
jgi:hypothetical protein